MSQAAFTNYFGHPSFASMSVRTLHLHDGLHLHAGFYFTLYYYVPKEGILGPVEAVVVDEGDATLALGSAGTGTVLQCGTAFLLAVL